MTSSDRKLEVFEDKAHNFKLTYPYSKKELKDGVVFFNSSQSEILRISYYPEQNIQDVISEWKEGMVYKNSWKIFEGDVRMNSCTAREIALGTFQKQYLYYFISFGKGTVALDAKGMEFKDFQKDTEEILDSFTCL